VGHTGKGGHLVKKYLYLAAAVAAVATPQAAYASLPTDNVWFDLGVFVAHIDSDLRLDNETLGLEGTRIDFENDLGLDNSRIMPKATAAARFLKRFRAQADWFQLNRSGNLMLNGQLVIDDTVGIVATANLDNRSFRLNFEVAAAFYDRATIDRLAKRFEIDREASHAFPAKRRPEMVTALFESVARLTSPVL